MGNQSKNKWLDRFDVDTVSNILLVLWTNVKTIIANRKGMDTPATFLFGYEEDVSGAWLSILMSSWWLHNNWGKCHKPIMMSHACRRWWRPFYFICKSVKVKGYLHLISVCQRLLASNLRIFFNWYVFDACCCCSLITLCLIPLLSTQLLNRRSCPRRCQQKPITVGAFKTGSILGYFMSEE